MVPVVICVDHSYVHGGLRQENENRWYQIQQARELKSQCQ